MFDSTLDIRAGRVGGVRRPSLYFRFFKRPLDLFLLLLMVPIVLPTLLVLATLVMSDGGPAFYSQERVGQRGL